METHLQLEEVSKSYGSVKAVDALSLAVPRGSVSGLLGPNGAGKTTTIRMIMRITLPDAGRLTLGGAPITDEVRERIGYLPEERGLYRKMKALDHLTFLAEVRGLRRPEARRRASAWLERLGLADKADSKVEELSKGMQQKVQFAGAVIHDPEFVIFDEPFTGLDPIATRQLKDDITAMRERGRTVLLSTHVLSQAEELCDAICLINRGRVVLSGRLAEVRARHARHALRVVARTDADALARVPGVAVTRPDNGAFVLELREGSAVAAVIRELAARFELASVEPVVDSLEDIFVRSVEEDHGPVA